jgi:hypothetical protein
VTSGRVLPVPTPVSARFWDGCAAGELLVQRCDACGDPFFPPLPACPRCLGTAVRWIRTSGLGAVYSYSVVHRPQVPGLSVPYIVAVVELQEGWRMASNVIDCDPEAVAIGLPLRVAFRPVGDMTLPFFVPATRKATR